MICYFMFWLLTCVGLFKTLCTVQVSSRQGNTLTRLVKHHTCLTRRAAQTRKYLNQPCQASHLLALIGSDKEYPSQTCDTTHLLILGRLVRAGYTNKAYCNQTCDAAYVGPG
jgi:hypothetical protein